MTRGYNSLRSVVLSLAVSGFVLNGCSDDINHHLQSRPSWVPEEAKFIPAEKSDGGKWADCEEVNFGELNCSFYDARMHTRTDVSYHLCKTRGFENQDVVSPFGIAPAWLQNNGAGYIDVRTLQYVPFSGINSYNLDSTGNWERDLEASKKFTDSFLGVFERICISRIDLLEF